MWTVYYIFKMPGCPYFTGMLIVFDVDGTLIGGEIHDWECFGRAIFTVLGFEAKAEFFASLDEITAQAIAEEAVRMANREVGMGLEEQIRDEYLRGLQEVLARDPLAFQPRGGVVNLLTHLASLPGVNVAIATGDWHSTISLKLAAAGIDISGYAMATSSDVRRRSAIIALAAERSQRELADVVYVGDGIWDLRACRDLGVHFVGTGSRPHLLRDAGAPHVMEVFEEELFMSAVRAMAVAKAE